MGGFCLLVGFSKLLKKSSFSWDSHHFQNGESFSPFLVILWDTLRFFQTLPPPRELLSISWDLQTKIINRPNFYTVFCRNQVSPEILIIFKMVSVSPNFSSACGIPRDWEMFSW